MRNIIVIVLLALSTTFEVACSSKPLSSDKVSGLYEYDSGSQATRSVCFVLSPDGTYALGDAAAPMQVISYSGTPSMGHWELLETAQDEQLRIGNSSFPIKRTSSGVRVVVDGDQDMYCDFAKLN
jgi:hypothetical protein